VSEIRRALRDIDIEIESHHQAVAELEGKRAAITSIFGDPTRVKKNGKKAAATGKAKGTAKAKTAADGKHQWSPSEKAKIAEKMKKIWADRKKAKAGAGTGPKAVPLLPKKGKAAPTAPVPEVVESGAQVGDQFTVTKDGEYQEVHAQAQTGTGTEGD